MARILAVTSRLPFPPREGHQHRSWHLLRALAARHPVTLLSLLRADDDVTDIEALRGDFAGIELFPLHDTRWRTALALLRSSVSATPLVALRYRHPGLRARIAELAPRSDLVHFDMLPLMQDAALVPAGVPVVYNAHNVEHALLAARARVSGRGLRGRLERAVLTRQVPRLRGFETAACIRADRVLACSAADAGALHALDARIRAEVVPNGVDLDLQRPEAAPAGGASGLVFVGQMGWFPNRDGVDWFLREVFPRILAARPDTHFVLVGKPGALQVPDAVADHVTVTGFVPDLRPLVHAAAVYVVPLRAGSGTRLKVLEAMALGTAIVTTTVGSEGIRLEPGTAALYADTAEDFASAVVALLDDPARREALAHNARAAAERHYGWDAIGAELAGLYGTLLPDAAVGVGDVDVRPPCPASLATRRRYHASPTSS